MKHPIKEVEEHHESQIKYPSSFSVHKPYLCEVLALGNEGLGKSTKGWEDISGRERALSKEESISLATEMYEVPVKKQQTP